MNQSELEMTVALFSLGAASPDALIAAANEVVDGGVVTPSAATLSMMSPGSADAEGEFTRMLRELKVDLPTQEQAVRTILRNRLRAIVDGEIEPLAGLQHLDDEIGLSGGGPLVPDSVAGLALRVHYYCEVCDPEVGKPDVRREVDAETIAVARQWLAVDGA